MNKMRSLYLIFSFILTLHIPAYSTLGTFGSKYLRSRRLLEETASPSSQPSTQPSGQPFGLPSSQPTAQPSQPSGQPTTQPSGQPTTQPSSIPSAGPSGQPTTQPSSQPSDQPSGQPSSLPSGKPSAQPSAQPSGQPFGLPSSQPTARPSQPSGQPTTQPSGQPTTQPSSIPSAGPSGQPTTQPSSQPTTQPSGQPTTQPSSIPSAGPSGQPTTQPSSQPTTHPSGRPTTQPSSQPSSITPSSQPSSVPSAQPTIRPSPAPTLPGLADDDGVLSSQENKDIIIFCSIGGSVAFLIMAIFLYRRYTLERQEKFAQTHGSAAAKKPSRGVLDEFADDHQKRSSMTSLSSRETRGSLYAFMSKLGSLARFSLTSTNRSQAEKRGSGRAGSPTNHLSRHDGGIDRYGDQEPPSPQREQPKGSVLGWAASLGQGLSVSVASSSTTSAMHSSHNSTDHQANLSARTGADGHVDDDGGRPSSPVMGIVSSLREESLSEESAVRALRHTDASQTGIGILSCLVLSCFILSSLLYSLH
jgi:hypothetical protein